MATKNGDENLGAVVNVRVTTAEKNQLKEDAHNASLTVSALVRRRYFGRPIIASSDAIMIRELRRLGGLLKHVHAESNGVYSTDTLGILKAIKKYIEVLTSDSQKN
jgi:hypothetical protein